MDPWGNWGAEPTSMTVRELTILLIVSTFTLFVTSSTGTCLDIGCYRNPMFSPDPHPQQFGSFVKSCMGGHWHQHLTNLAEKKYEKMTGSKTK